MLGAYQISPAGLMVALTLDTDSALFWRICWTLATPTCLLRYAGLETVHVVIDATMEL